VISHEEGTVDLTGHALSQIQRISETSEEYGTLSTTNEMYLFNSTIYTRSNNKWNKMEGDSVKNLLADMNIIENESRMINSSDIRLLGFKEIDGEECYLIEVRPDQRSFASILSKSQSDFPMEIIDMGKLLNDSRIQWNSWITKDTHYLKRNDIKIALTGSAENLGIPIKNINNIKFNTSIISLYNDYNLPIVENFSNDFKIAYPFPLIGTRATIFGVIQQDEAGNGYNSDDKIVYVDVATTGYEKASLVDVDDRYYESDRNGGTSDRKFIRFELPNGTTIKRIRFEPIHDYENSELPFGFDLRLDKLGSTRRNPIEKASFNGSDKNVYLEIYKLSQEDNYYESSESLLIDLAIDLKVTNTGAGELLLDLEDFRLIDQFGWEYPAESDYRSSDLGSLLPGESRRFDLVISEVSILSNPVTLKYKTLGINVE
jgi:hypothetical protein